MAAKKVGVLIKEARTAAGLTQEQLAKKVKDVSASDISKTERGEKDLTQAQLKEIAKACGVTQKSLLEAPSNLSASAKKKTSSSSSSSKKKTTAKTSSMKLTASEKKLVEYYRAASSTAKKAAVNILKGTKDADASDVSGLITSLFSGALGKIGSSSSKSMPLFDDDDEFDFNEIVDENENEEA
ncbi:MAG: helix-turn-helix domain-containing protein [Clostridia bacterium]|nr:helix-turn-helix domain-containing protein [Clostridia bacterium]